MFVLLLWIGLVNFHYQAAANSKLFEEINYKAWPSCNDDEDDVCLLFELEVVNAKITARHSYSLAPPLMEWYGMVWYGMVWYGMVWCGMVWYHTGNPFHGVVWYGMVVSYSLAPPPSPRTHMARGHSWRIWCDEIRIGNAWIKLTLNADDIQEVIYGYEERNPHKHTTRWSLKRLLYWRCEKTEARFVKCDSPLQRYWAWLQWRWDEDNDDDEEDVRMMGMISKTHPTTIPWSDLLSQLGQLCVHEGDVVLTWTKKSWKILWTTNESKCSDRPTPSSQPSTCNASLCLGSCNPGREKKFIQKSIN